MPQLAPTIVCHRKMRTIECCLCGAVWEERLTAIVLAEDEAQLDSICPRCLQRGPERTAALLRQKESGLKALLFSTPSLDIADLAARIAQMHAKTRLTCAATARLLERSAALREELNRITGELADLKTMQERIIERARQLTGLAAPKAKTVLEAAAHADALLAVSHHLARLERWPVSVADAIAAERTAFAERCRTRTLSKDMAAVIGSRYKEFLRRAG